jgi:hypothetical protein
MIRKPTNQPDDCRATIGFPCVDGPLVGEFHQQGESFEIDGAGLESGTYVLHDGRYVWHAAPKSLGET